MKFRCLEIVCLNYRFPTSSLTKDESILRIAKLERQVSDIEGLDCNRGCFKAVNPDFHIELDNSDMFLPKLERRNPINFVCKNVLVLAKFLTRILLGSHRRKLFLTTWQ